MPRCTPGSKRAPCGVSRTERLWRTKSGVSRNSSSDLMCELTAAVVTLRACAALVKLRWAATASKARKAFKGSLVASLIVQRLFKNYLIEEHVRHMKVLRT